MTDPALIRARSLKAVCEKFTGGYTWGGGHVADIRKLRFSAGMDCSGSVFKALSAAPALISDFDTRDNNSVTLESYGVKGPGKYVTIHANADHVWIEFTLPEGWSRFDTSPHKCGSLGPRVRTCKRPTTNFVRRHPPGL